jgi:hypothetical protein
MRVETDVAITAPPWTDRPFARLPLSRDAARSAAVIVAYLSIGIVAYWPVYPGISQHLFGVGGDFTQTVWFLDWIPHALIHGLNPFFTNAILVPSGVNLAQNTESPMLGLITAPLSLVFGPVVGANLLLVLAMPISATAAFVVLRKWQVWGPAAALGGLVYGFSPFMVGHGLGHLEILFVPLPPLIALTVASILQNQGSPWALGIRLGLLVTAQYLIAPEVLASVTMFIVAAVVCVGLRNPAQVPEMVRTASRATALAIAVAAVLLAYPVWMIIGGPDHFTGPPFATTNLFHNDLLSFFAPGPLQRVSLGMRSIGNRLASGPGATEAGGYIGIPVVVLTGILAWRSRRSLRMQLALVLLFGAALLSLGPHLAINGRLTAVPLPFVVVDHIPLIDGMLPSRISFEVGACLAAMIAFGLDDVHRAPVDRSCGSVRAGRMRGRASAAFAGITLAVLVATQLPLWPRQGPYAAPPAVSLPATLTRAIPSGNPVAMTYPYDTYYTNQPMLWQATDHFRFRLLGGYAYTSTPGGHPTLLPPIMSPAGTQQFLADHEGVSIYGPALPVGPGLVAATRTTVSKYHIRLVIVDRSMSGSGPVVELFDDALGPPKVSTGQFSLWADWHGWPSPEQLLPHLSTSVLRPVSGATLSGTSVLDARAAGFYGVTRVEFLLTDGAHHRAPIGTGHLTIVGWLATWNTASVANGTYAVQSVAYDSSGGSRVSSSTTITINN